MTRCFVLRRATVTCLSGALCLAILATTGCSGAKGGLSGKVYYEDKLLGFGSVFFYASDGKPRSAVIDKDGNYLFSEVPTGKVTLAVLSPDPSKFPPKREPPPGVKGPPATAVGKLADDFSGGDPSKWFAIPKSYGNVNTSGLTFTIAQGSNTYDIKMVARDEATKKQAE
jgi:hypothetical protein